MCKGRDAGNGKEGRSGTRRRIHREKGEIDRSEGQGGKRKVHGGRTQDGEKDTSREGGGKRREGDREGEKKGRKDLD